MKNNFKLSAAMVIVLSLAACGAKKDTGSTDSTSTTTVKVDSSVKTTITVDSTKKDTAKKDSAKM